MQRIKRYRWVLIGLVALASNARAADPCHAADIRRIARPNYPDHAQDSPVFNYAYEVYRPAKPGFATIVVLTGGPGETTIGRGPGEASRFPEGMGVVLLDPRGVGCNQPPAGAQTPLDFYSTPNLASDTLAVVKDLGLQHYILFGSSYGSMVATEAAGLAERQGGVKPDSVVIEGVLGRAFRPMETFDGFVQQWDRDHAALPPALQQAVDGPTPPFGLSHAQWGNWVANQLVFRFQPPNPGSPGTDPNLRSLSLLLQNASQAAKTQLAQSVQGAWTNSISPKPDALAMYRAITCREIAQEVWNPNMDVAFNLDRGKLVPIVARLCQGLPMDRPYNAMDWKTTVPIYYFVGGRDPSTPPTQAAYHFGAETEADRTYVAIPDGGHCALSSSLADCSKGVWAAINAGGANLQQALSACRFDTRVQHSGPSSPFLAEHRAALPAPDAHRVGG